MSLSRRQWLIASSAALALPTLSACAQRQLQTSATGFSRHTLGSATLWAISDGSTARPLDAGFVRNAELAQVKALLAAQRLPTTHLDVPYTCYVLELGGKRYLFDTGFGDNGPTGTGLLHTHLLQAGIAPESIDAIILSHLHGDHINGLRRKGGALMFPQATVWVPLPEMEYWGDAHRMHAASEAARPGFANVRRVFAHYPRERVRLFTPGADIAPGITSVAAFGHSPGHTAFHMDVDGQRFTYLGDAAHHPALFVRQPDWQVQFDMQPEQARQTRHELLSQLTRETGWVGGYHFPLPGMGKLHVHEAGYAWVPVRQTL